jgi:2-polyprenyl-3-methyl-5-hydroxy-6-metoxy-1,4-benzoquinol methylase
VSSEYQFKDIDQEGLDTLDAISKADLFNEWMYHTIKPFCKGKILEVGSGIGNISQFFIRDKAQIVLSDIRDNYIEILKEKYTEANVISIEKIDLVDEQFDANYKSLFNTFDTIFALNVVEHIKDDVLAMQNCNKLLKQDGHLIILVPAYQILFNKFDTELEHYRRYTTDLLRKRMQQNFTIIHSQYFNATGILGWIFSGNILRKKTIPAGQMTLYNKLVPIFKIVDKVLLNLIGLSAVVVGKKD